MAVLDEFWGRFFDFQGKFVDFSPIVLQLSMKTGKIALKDMEDNRKAPEEVADC